MAEVRDLDTLTPGEILAAARELTRDVPGRFGAYGVLWAIAERCGSSSSAISGTSWDRLAVQDRYAGRVKRALDKLAIEGSLIRVGLGDKGPDGRTNRRGVYYYRPAAYRDAQQKAADREAETAAALARWEVAGARLGAQGILMAEYGRISLSELEKLLDKAGW